MEGSPEPLTTLEPEQLPITAKLVSGVSELEIERTCCSARNHGVVSGSDPHVPVELPFMLENFPQFGGE